MFTPKTLPFASTLADEGVLLVHDVTFLPPVNSRRFDVSPTFIVRLAISLKAEEGSAAVLTANSEIGRITGIALTAVLCNSSEETSPHTKLGAEQNFIA